MSLRCLLGGHRWAVIPAPMPEYHANGRRKLRAAPADVRCIRCGHEDYSFLTPLPRGRFES